MGSTRSADLRRLIAKEAMLRDVPRLERRLDRVRRIRDEEQRKVALVDLRAQATGSAGRARRRGELRPTLDFPSQLPITHTVDELRTAIADNQVVVVAGETGSGKTTQLPKICLDLGRGRRGMIGHTQPRRIAARAVAERLAEETRTDLGKEIGYQVRFTETAGPDTLVKVMTDGILLAEISHDRHLRKYDTIIIDEAHERSLTIDFLLGYLPRILPRRPDLKVIITSATIDPGRFAEHFGGAPMISVSGRTYPVEIRYRPLNPEQGANAPGKASPGTAADLMDAIREGVDEVCAVGPGDVLVFLSGEREIRDAADALADHRPPGPGPVDVLPLFGRLSAADQHRVFSTHQGRRIVLATNIAETSLTVPGIRYVVDAGTARISRFSPRTKVQRLPIEAISQASAIQRAGRCGRVADGVCVRLYSEDDYETRPAFTEPEILRTNLAAVLLRMVDMNLGDLSEFPFLDPPDPRHIASGIALLHELGAIEQPGPGGSAAGPRLTSIGRAMARLPVDPRIARMILGASQEGSLAEVLAIAAGLTIQDPRERPQEKLQVAEASHARFSDPTSDFVAILNLWRYATQRSATLSGSAFRRMCKREFLHFLRIREWQDLHSQLRRACRDLGLSENDVPADSDRIHRAILTGLPSHVGMWEERSRQYLGARNARFQVSRGSGLAKKRPAWVMVAELVQTNRTWGHTAAAIKPRWLEDVAAHLLHHEYSEPRWDRGREAVMATQRSTLYDLPVVAGRAVTYSSIDPAICRELFIRHALVEGHWDAPHRFLEHNRRLMQDVRKAEERQRRRDLIVDDDTLIDFFDKRLPSDAVSGRHFSTWWKRERVQQPHLLDWTPELLLSERAQRPDPGAREWRFGPDSPPAGGPLVTEPGPPPVTDQGTDTSPLPHDDSDSARYPRTWQIGEVALPLSYRFEPGAPDDGVTVDIPLALLRDLRTDDLTWGIPAQRAELLTAMLRSLPKPLRKPLVPIPDTAARLVQHLGAAPVGGSLPSALAAVVTRESGVQVRAEDFDMDKVPAHLRPRYRIEDPSGDTLATGRDIEPLRQQLVHHWSDLTATSTPQWSRHDLRDWDFGDLPDTVRLDVGGLPVELHPGLVEVDGRVDLQVHDTPWLRDGLHRPAVARLLQLEVGSPQRHVVRALTQKQKLVLPSSRYASVAELIDDCALAAIDRRIGDELPHDRSSFQNARADVSAHLVADTTAAVGAAAVCLQQDIDVGRRLEDMTNPALAAAVDDIAAQREWLIGPGFVRRAGTERLPDVARYLTAIARRIDAMPGRLARDTDLMAAILDVSQHWASVRQDLAPRRHQDRDVVDMDWRLQELRVALFAQTLGTKGSASVKRLKRAIAEVATSEPAPEVG